MEFVGQPVRDLDRLSAVQMDDPDIPIAGPITGKGHPGVIRPEVVIPLASDSIGSGEHEIKHKAIVGLVIGSPVRVIREPYFGRIGTVTSLPPELQRLESEAMVRVLEVKFEDGAEAIIPRANVELIEE